MSHLGQIDLFAELGLTIEPEPPPMPARERHRGEVIIETFARCLTAPTIYCISNTSAIPVPEEFLRKHRIVIEAERFARLQHLLKDDPDCSLDRIRACATTLTNPEICGILSVISGLAPMDDQLVAEYMRAFAHVFPFEVCMPVFASFYGDPIPLHQVEGFYREFGGRKGFGYLDDRERAWINDFNQKARQWKANH